MRGIILAAGQGTRLGVLTEDIPKCLVPFRGRSILERAVESLRTAGVTDLAVVTGWQAEKIRALGLPTRFNPDFATTNMVASLFCAEDLMDGDDVLVVYGDTVFKPDLVEALARTEAPFALAVNTRWRELWELRMADPLSDVETLKLDAGGNIVELGKKPRSYADVQGQFTGLIRIAHHALPRVRTFYRRLDVSRRYDGKDFRNMFMTSFLQEVIDHLMPVKAVLVSGGWLEIDSIADLEAYERLPADFLG
jgi:L-glutamine-phosphate cytidylyltransferase